MTLSFENLQAIRGGRALSDPISLTLETGNVLALVGPNGAGKSSLLAALAHTGIAHTGRVMHDGVDLSKLKASRRAHRISLLAQDSRGTDELRVHELVDIGARAGGPAREIGARRDTAIAQIGIADIADRKLGTLSGGQRQLAQLARVAAQRTPIVLLDEPAAALDLGHQVLIEQVTEAFAAEGRIVIAAVHDLSFALSFASHALLLSPGGAVVHGTPADVLTADSIERAYGVRTSFIPTAAGRTLLAIDSRVPSDAIG